MNDVPTSDPISTARDLWRGARRRGWHRGAMSIELGWRAGTERQVSQLRKAVLGRPHYVLAPPEAFEPEDDPLELVIHGTPRRLSGAAFEEEVRWAQSVCTPFGATLSRLGLQRTDAR